MKVLQRMGLGLAACIFSLFVFESCGLFEPLSGIDPPDASDGATDGDGATGGDEATGGDGAADGDAGSNDTTDQDGTDQTDSTLPVCGNRIVEQGELCDSDIQDCASLDPTLFIGGNAPCDGTCTDYDVRSCIKRDPDPQPVDIGPEPTQYLDLEELYAAMRSWADKAPFAEVGTYGKSGGLDNLYLRISKAVMQPNLDLPKPEIDAGIHGDEWIGVAVVVNVAHRLISGYARDPKVTELINTRDIYIIPVINPVGYRAQSRLDNGRDPNRSFPYPNDPNNQPTTSVNNYMKLFSDKGFNATINYHASGRMVMLPWGYTTQPFNEGDAGSKHRVLAQKMSTLSGYRWGSVPDMVGYVAGGGSIDWLYLEGKRDGFKTCTMAVEVGTSKKPAASAIPIETKKNYQMLLTFIDEAPVLLRSKEPVEDIVPPVYDGLSPYFVPGLE